MPKQFLRCRSTKATATMLLGSPASCRRVGSRRCMSRISTATRSEHCWGVGHCTVNVFAVRAEELIEDRPELVAAVRPLLEARNAVEQQVRELDRIQEL